MGIRDYFNNIALYDQAVRDNMRRKKPGAYCSNTCFVNDSRCKECLELQKKIERSVSRIEQIEKTLNLNEDQIKQINKNKKLTRCNFCGAPYEINYFSCPYCDTPYPKDIIDFEIPLSITSRSLEINKQVEEAWNLLIKKWELVKKYNQNNIQPKSLNNKLRQMLHGTPEQNWPQTTVEINWAASLYGVSISQYIQGVAMEQLQSPNNLYQGEQDYTLQQQIGAALGINIPSRTYVNSNNRQINTTSNNNQKSYSSAGEKCSTCHYYLAGSNKCNKEGNKNPSGPNDSCSFHIKKPRILR